MIPKRFRSRVALSLLLAAVAATAPQGQSTIFVQADSGRVGLGLILRRLATTATFMMATAHPDDENNALLVMLSRGQGVRTALTTATRGDGGQNEIGPELFDALAVLRTEELLAMHGYDGAEQYFTRAVDFGYSFSIEETLEKWGHDEIVGDYVRLIRMIRPDVISAMRPEGQGGGMHHQASAMLAREAFKVAGDPAQYPEQLKDGLRPWQPRKFYFTASYGFRGEPPPAPDAKNLLSVDSGVYDSLLGHTYAEIGSAARSMHKCQGMAQLLTLPGPAVVKYRLVESTLQGQMDKEEKSFFDDIDTTVEGLARFAGAGAPPTLTAGLAGVARDIHAAQTAFDEGRDAQLIPSLLSALDQTRGARGALHSSGVDDTAQFEIDFRLARKEEDLQRAITLAQGIRLEALSDDGVVTAGQEVTVQTIVANRGTRHLAVKNVRFAGFDSETSGCELSTLHAAGISNCTSRLRVPQDARITDVYWKRLTDGARYVFDPDVPFGAPFRPTPFLTRIDFEIGGRTVTAQIPVMYRYEGNIFNGEKRMELKVVPSFAVAVTPDITIFPVTSSRSTPSTNGGSHSGRSPVGPVRTVTSTAARKGEREVRVTVTNNNKAAATGEALLGIPEGWQSFPVRAPIAFSREDESQTVRFTLKAAGVPSPGQFSIGAIVRAGGKEYTDGYQVVEYPHTHRRHLRHQASTTLKAIDVKLAPDLLVGYITGVGDQVPAAIEQLGARLELIGADDLAWGDLSRYAAIVTGVRAYERRPDLRANNARLLKYVENGGVLIVQYNKFEFNEAQYAPYPAKVSASRVTDERAPLDILVPTHPVFNTPNRIDASAWDGWVQERGLYFLGEKDPRYRDLLRMSDPFPLNSGEKLGALVEATPGRGRWIYLGLGLWRELPAGVDGAYRLLANLLSLGHQRPARGVSAASK